MEEECVFRAIYGNECAKQKTSLQKNSGPARVFAIIEASKHYGDELHERLEAKLKDDEHFTIAYHKNCVSRYTSKTNIKSRSSVQSEQVPQPMKKLRRSHSEFDFMKHCLYCGEECKLEKDPKNPGRWQPAYMCRSTVSEVDKRPYKEFLLERCDVRGDDWGTDMRVRIEGALDLHAAEARYHRKCMSRFFSIRKQSENETSLDQALDEVYQKMLKDKSKIWNSIDLHDMYTKNGGTELNRKGLVKKVQSKFLDEIVVLTSPGYANIIAFSNSAGSVLRVMKDDSEDADLENCIQKVSKQIIKDCKNITYDKTMYSVHIDRNSAADSSSATFQVLLKNISPALDKTLPALLMGNMVTSTLRRHPTDLQIALGVLMRDSKKLINNLYDFGVTCSYDEVQRFKRSAAKAASQDISLQGISDATNGLVQVIADNFDADISCPNGKLSTHSLATIITQPERETGTMGCNTINRITKCEMSEPVQDDEDEYDLLETCHVPPKPSMPDVPLSRVTSDVETLQEVSKARAESLDVTFLHDIMCQDKCPEYNGYLTKTAREQGHVTQPKTKVVYLPLIDSPPSNPSTMRVCMLRAKKVSEATGQEYVIFTADQQLYRVALHIQWTDQITFKNIYLRLGGMHILMSYVGCVGTLMENTGLTEVLSGPFGGVQKMLSGKKFPENVRALRMLVEELLRPVFTAQNIQTTQEFWNVLDDLSSRSRTAHLWIDCLIRPVMIMMKYIRAERESDWPLHMHSVNEMIPLFFAAGHQNYARYGLYYIRSMEAMPSEVRKHFIKGEHTMHHTAGLANGIWSDMAIETTYMRYGHGRSGIIGLTLKPESLKTWSYSLHTCNRVISDLDDMREDDIPSQTCHKEEMPGRMNSDSKDRKALREKVQMAVDPLDPEQHPREGLINIATGSVLIQPQINVEKSADIGKKQMKDFESGWPDSFHSTIPRKVTTMALTKKHLKVGEAEVFDTETIYARAMGLQSSPRALNTSILLSHELAPHPTAIFDEHGHMREAKSKANLKNALKVEVSGRAIESSVQAKFLDGCAVLWVIPWPMNGTVQDFLNAFRKYVHNHHRRCDVYLVFDR